MSGGDFQGLRRALTAALEGFEPLPHSVWLYGSRARGDANEESDYDFAVAAERRLSRAELGELRRRFEGALERAGLGSPDLDLVDIQAAPTTLAAQILEADRVLLCTDERARAFLETRLLSMYAALNEERREVLEAIVERGRVHA